MFRGFLLAFSYNGPLNGTGFSFRDRHQEYNTQKYRTIGDGCYNGFEAIHTLDLNHSPPPPGKICSTMNIFVVSILPPAFMVGENGRPRKIK